MAATLTSLPDYNRTGANEQDRLKINAFRHASSTVGD